jgi:hypothetical protein
MAQCLAINVEGLMARMRYDMQNPYLAGKGIRQFNGSLHYG